MKLTKTCHVCGHAVDDTNWYDEYKHMEQAYMSLMDAHSELVRALGYEGFGFYGDPIVKHEDVVAHAKQLQAMWEDWI